MSAAAVREYENETVSISQPAHVVANRPRVETYSYVSFGAGNRTATVFSLLPLFSFVVNGEVKPLRQPVMLRVAVEHGEYFVENDALRLFGNGRTLLEAVRAFSADLAYSWQRYLSLRDDEVAGHGADLKRLYSNLAS